MRITKIKNPPPRGDFPKELGEKWGAVYDAALEKYGSKKIAAAVAWTVIKKSWKKSEKTGKWVKIKKPKKKTTKRKTKKKVTKRLTKRKTTKRKVKKKSAKRKTLRKKKSTKK